MKGGIVFAAVLITVTHAYADGPRYGVSSEITVTVEQGAIVNEENGQVDTSEGETPVQIEVTETGIMVLY